MRRSIATKIVVTVGGIVSIVLLVGWGVLVKFEIHQEQLVMNNYIADINRTIVSQEQEEHAALKRNVTSNASILRRMTARYLYDFDIEELKQSLAAYMDYPEILAVQVWNETNVPVAAAWRTSKVIIGDEIPMDLALDDQLSIQVETLMNDEYIGKFHVFYTDRFIQEKMQDVKEKVLAQQKIFRHEIRSRLTRTIIGQSIGVIIILLVLTSCLIVSFRILVLRPLSLIVSISHRLAEFDLTVHIPSEQSDEVGDLLAALNKMARSFKHVVSLVQRSGRWVFSSAEDLSQTAEQQEATMTNQVESTASAAKSVQEISQIIAELAQTMQRVASMSQETAEYASRGQANLFRMEEAMRTMEEATHSISDKLEAINDKAENITTVVTTINKVSEQTNLLSLNASIEAEKAGEYGRGFSVVAREIRRLADQTAVATLNIDRMVSEMRMAVSDGVMEMEKFVAEVRRSSEDVGKISTQLTLIIDQVQALSPNFETVNVSMRQQSANARNISDVMAELNKEMIQTKDSLQGIYAVIEQLNEAAKDLQNEVFRFKVN